jgi:hypothetical protein
MKNKTKTKTKTKVATKYYYIFVWHDVDPEINGPYKTPQKRFEAVCKSVEENGLDGNSHFWLDNTNGRLSIGTYSGSDFDTDDCDY